MNIGPIKQMMQNMGITEEDIDAVSEQFGDIMDNMDDFQLGGAGTMPFMQNLFGGSNNNAAPQGEEVEAELDEDEEPAEDDKKSNTNINSNVVKENKVEYDSTQVENNSTQEVENKDPWDDLGITEYEYFNKPMWSWARVDYSIKDYVTQELTQKACIDAESDAKRKTDEFEKENGSYICRDLLECDISTEEGVKYALDNNYISAEKAANEYSDILIKKNKTQKNNFCYLSKNIKK